MAVAKAMFTLLHQISHRSHTYIGRLEIEYTGKPTIDAFRKAAQPSIDLTLPGVNVDEVQLQLYEYSGPPALRSRKVEEVVNNGENMEPINHDDDFDDFEVGSSAKTIIAVFARLAVQFSLIMCENDSSSCMFTGSRDVVVSSNDTVEVIEQAARAFATEYLSRGDPAIEFTKLIGVNVYEPKVLYKEAYSMTPEKIENLDLGGGQLMRHKGLTSILVSQDPVSKIKSRNLIAEFILSRHRKLRIDHALFERKPESFEFVGYRTVDTSSEQTMQIIWDAVRAHIKLLPRHGVNTEHIIQVYEPTKAFEEAYGKPASHLGDLKLEERHFEVSPLKCVLLSPQTPLSDFTGRITVIVVFCLPARPIPTLVDEFLRLKIVLDAPSNVSKPENYRAIQKQPQQRILDDRPRADRFIPPISLLYDGFGIFDDVFRGQSSVPGENDIVEADLWREANAFADQMAEFYDTEAKRQDAVFRCLERIFRARRDSEAAINSRQMISDGHSKGAHGAIVFRVECKNELTNISREPSAELVSYIASSFKEDVNGEHRALFHAWRVPALGMTQIGAFVQFFGVVMLTPQMRVIPLTPMLPLATPADDEWSRQRLFLAFKAASIVISKIETDILRLIKKTPPEIPLELRGLPSVTGIEMESSRIEFALTGRYDTENGYRNLYHARLIPTGEEICVKFTQRYSRELHIFCAERELAPKLLGFERLPGGWFALAMEKVDIVAAPWEIGPLHELDKWKEKISELVDGFHQEGLVHGDLRLANFIFTKATPRKMLLIDFDWGGKEKEVLARGQLAQELHALDDRLDRPITKEDDDRPVLLGTFRLLEEVAAAVLRATQDKPDPSGGTEMEVDSGESS